MAPKNSMTWSDWLDGWEEALSANGFDDVEALPIFDVADSDMAQLALEKMWYTFWENNRSPEEALALAWDRDAFAVEFYDPYIEEFEEELGSALRTTAF